MTDEEIKQRIALFFNALLIHRKRSPFPAGEGFKYGINRKFIYTHQTDKSKFEIHLKI